MEIKQLKKRIDESKTKGIPTAHIREDYNPAGDMMIARLITTQNYVTCRYSTGSSFCDATYRVFRKEYKPY